MNDQQMLQFVSLTINSQEDSLFQYLLKELMNYMRLVD